MVCAILPIPHGKGKSERSYADQKEWDEITKDIELMDESVGRLLVLVVEQSWMRKELI